METNFKPKRGKPKAGKGRETFDDPEALRLKKKAFEFFVGGGSLNKVQQMLNYRSAQAIRSLLYSEKWDKYKQMWLDNPDKKNPYPWDIENPKVLLPPPPNMENMDRELRLKCIRAFGLYCTGRGLREISDELKIPYYTLKTWSLYQRWSHCKDRLLDKDAPPPWENEDVPTTLAELTATLEAMQKSIKFLVGNVLVKAASAAQDLDGTEALGMTRELKQLAEATQINFSENNKNGNNVQINIATKLESLKIPDNNTFEAELVIDDE